MNKPLLAGIGAGLIAFVALASAQAGSPPVQFLMLLLAPLPIYLAGLSLGWMTAAIAAVTGFIAITLVSGPLVGLLAAGTQFGPAVYLCYLVLLNREYLAEDGTVVTEWYPVGRLVLWACAIGTLLTVVLLFLLGRGDAELQDNLGNILRGTIEQAMNQRGDGAKIPDEDVEAMVRLAIALLPAAAGMMMTGFQLLVLYLAARITRAAGHFTRRWPDLAAITYPPVTPLLLAGSFVLSAVLPGFLGRTAAAASGALYLAYILLGLAIITYVTRGSPWRFMLLWAVYFGLIVFNTIVSLIVAIIGLAEPFSPLRRDFLKQPRSGPPSSGPPPGPSSSGQPPET